MSQGEEVHSVNLREVVECRRDKEISRERFLKLIGPIAEEAGLDPGQTLTISIDGKHIEIITADGMDGSEPVTLRNIKQVLKVVDVELPF